ncbi:transcriptional regulator, LacI family [Gracilibacillus ureilyticus]|uniref:Transcriptional regulator, LacI family n=1 Tax=Gracilibacillus ureilyticus TaxID=531814 RepID=A0A1H9PUR6_9BACI|nr:substrate-binding domain-containing protein [Gracilibacillus ureilyticus]SER51575.1 transcriptional regulator, LacI family [Gracilibacillus ureilyticus]
MKKVTITDVAKKAGVSKSTVSQYLNERYDYMGEKTKERIKSAIEDLNYSPNYLARSLKQKQTNTIGVIVANILHVFSTHVIRSIQDFCNERHFHVIVCNADDDPDKEKQFIEMLYAKQVDGMIIFPTGGNIALYKKLTNENYPIVFMDRIVPDIEIDTVLLDNKKASLIAVNNFIQNGYRKIGVISPPLIQSLTPRIERINGYKQALQLHDIPLKAEYIADTSFDKVSVHLTRMLNLKDPPGAILALNDLVLFEILAFVKTNKIRIPQDLAIIGIDDVIFASIYHPSLTTIAQPAFSMGKKAANLLLTKINNKMETGDGGIYRFEPALIIRESL